MNSEIFSTVPKKDFLNFFVANQVMTHRVLAFLEIDLKDFCRHEGKDLAVKWAVLLNVVAQHFDGNKQKTKLWFFIENPVFNWITPREMLLSGQTDKVLKIVQENI